MNQIFNVHGPNARVNIDSTDNSTNIVSQGIHFSELRKAIESGVADGVERATILERLTELEMATDRENQGRRDTRHSSLPHTIIWHSSDRTCQFWGIGCITWRLH